MVTKDGNAHDDGNYDGRVSPGDPAQTRTAGCLEITKVAVDADMSNNCYVLHCTERDDTILIDAADDASTLLGLIGDRRLSAIVTTHQHWDHHRALAEVAAAHPDAEIVAGEPDAGDITKQTGVDVTRPVADGDTVTVGSCDLRVVRLTGHTPGSIALYFEADGGHLWTGDSLFPGGVGNTFGDDDAFHRLLDDVESKLFDALPESTYFYPGHGDDSTLGKEKPSLPDWRRRGW